MISAAKRSGLLGSRILFPPPVPERDLISRAAQADIGLVPYEPTLINHIHCSPNKLSQYMAAGLPILANNTRFVEQIVRQAECGTVVDFNDPAQLASAVSKLADDAQYRQKLGLNARRGFETFFNWDAYAQALDATAGSPQRGAILSANDPIAALNSVFQTMTPHRAPGSGSALSRFGKSALRLALHAAWHGVPFLRVIMLNNPRFRRRAEELREL
ncbi:MAG: glycosyltransferase [Burkholderiales bacterium]|nr:MAG: glycosyltransferase [Burkholderiales bacterium]